MIGYRLLILFNNKGGLFFYSTIAVWCIKNRYASKFWCRFVHACRYVTKLILPFMVSSLNEPEYATPYIVNLTKSYLLLTQMIWNR